MTNAPPILMPANTVAAVTHPDPYPYYRALARRGVHREAATGAVIAAGKDAVAAALTQPWLGVRPPDEPIPAGMIGTSLGAVFGDLARMTDGAAHAARRERVMALMLGLTAERVATEIDAAVSDLLDGAVPDPALVDRVGRRAPVAAILRCMGVPETPELIDSAIDFAFALAPGATAEPIARGVAAVGHLLPAFARAPLPVGCDGEVGGLIVANAVGLLLQTQAATAGLIGNLLLRLRRSGAAPDPADPGAWTSGVIATLRDDPPTHNTRRFAALDGALGGVSVGRGEAVLVVLASAPGTGFGHGTHACPGRDLALTIAARTAARLVAAGCLDGLPIVPAYEPSLNSRIPFFAPKEARP